MVKAQQNLQLKCKKPKKKKRKDHKDKGGGVKKKKDEKNEHSGKQKRDKKDSRRRKKYVSTGGGDALACCVLLTRLDEKGVVGKVKNTKVKKQKSVKVKKKECPIQSVTKSGPMKSSTANWQTLEPKKNQDGALLTFPSPAVKPRRRRMASLNAEAVNSLLLYRDSSLVTNLTKKWEPFRDKTDKGLTKAKNVNSDGKAVLKERAKKSKKSTAQAQEIDWLTVLAPTPRRQAGLTAAALLKLTSTQYGTKRQKKKTESKSGVGSEPTAFEQSDINSKPVIGETAQAKRRPYVKHEEQLKHRIQGAEESVHPQLNSALQGCCSLCKTEALDPEWKSATGQGCFQHTFHCGSSLGFSLKPIKEEQMETEVSSCYCCTQERCVEYCHRLALFLEDKTFKEPEDGSLSDVFHHHHHHYHHHHHHHLQSPHAVAHPAAITISPHSYTCFPSYYVHFSHPDGSPSPIPPHALCPRSSKRPKLHPSTGPKPSGISHSVYCCTSVEACYGEPCRINGFSAYSSVIPAIPRGGSPFSPKDCTKCNHSIKRDDYPSTISDHHSPSSIPICPSPRTLTGCPVPTVPPAGQSAPHVQTPLSDPSQPQPPLQVAKECPQSAKPPSGSRSGAHGNSPVSPLNRDKKQRLGSASAGGQVVTKQPKNSRQKSTNGWKPVGLPFEKEVFIVDEETLVLRKSFEGIRRDGDVIRVRDTVLLKSGPRKKTLPYVAKVSALWEEPESGELMMSLFWYYRPEHTQGGRNPTIHCENEIFASRHQDVNSVACIEDKCYVLTLAQYCRFCALVKRRREGVCDNAASLVVPPAVDNAMPTHRCVPDDVDPEMVFFCRHVYDFRYGRLLKNLQ